MDNRTNTIIPFVYLVVLLPNIKNPKGSVLSVEKKLKSYFKIYFQDTNEINDL